MKKILVLFLLSKLPLICAQNQKPATLKSILLEQLQTVHNQKDWFVPVNIAVEGLTPDQAKWKDKSGNHSISELVNHLIFWNERALEKFEDQKAAPFDGNNEETFSKSMESSDWSAAVQKLNTVMADWEKAVEQADDAKLQKWASTIAHIGTHTAYHTGQMIYIRRLQGSWSAEKGVK